MPKFRCPDCGRFWPATSTGQDPCQCNAEDGPKPVKNARDAHTDLVLGRLETLVQLDHLSTSDKAKIMLAIAEIKFLCDHVALLQAEFEKMKAPAVITYPEVPAVEVLDHLKKQWLETLTRSLNMVSLSDITTSVIPPSGRA